MKKASLVFIRMVFFRVGLFSVTIRIIFNSHSELNAPGKAVYQFNKVQVFRQNLANISCHIC
jgi:hypothetical protein